MNEGETPVDCNEVEKAINENFDQYAAGIINVQACVPSPYPTGDQDAAGIFATPSFSTTSQAALEVPRREDIPAGEGLGEVREARQDVGLASRMITYYEKLEAYKKKLAAFKRGERRRRPSKPYIKMPTFLSFIRSPFCVSFKITGHPGSEPYTFMAINAHLYFGNTMDDRRQEFDALMNWIRSRVTENDRAYYPNFILMGDLNLDFDKPEADRKRIATHLKTFNDAAGKNVTVNFPFLNVHKGQPSIFRTNARLTETFDQIGLFCRDKRFPSFELNSKMDPAKTPCGPDYGLFNFVELFSQSLYGKSFKNLSAATKKKFYPRFEHKVSDHMPLWFRLPLG